MTVQSFRHQASDQWIAITNNDVESIYPYSWWTTQETSYVLPDKYIYREYLKNRNIPIVSLNMYTNFYVTAVTVNPHDLKLDDQLTINGADQEGYNGFQRVCEIIDENTFVYCIMNLPSVTPATGSISGTTYGYHRVIATTGQYEAPEGFPWGDGDLYISRKSQYDAAYAEYLNTPKTLEEAKTTKINNLFAKMFEVRGGGVIYSTFTFKSNDLFYQRILTDNLHFTADGNVPVGYYVNDINDDQCPFTLIKLQELTQLIQDLHYQCWLTFDIHYEAIQACTQIEQVQMYDITSGWVVVPYN